MAAFFVLQKITGEHPIYARRPVLNHVRMIILNVGTRIRFADNEVFQATRSDGGFLSVGKNDAGDDCDVLSSFLKARCALRLGAVSEADFHRFLPDLEGAGQSAERTPKERKRAILCSISPRSRLRWLSGAVAKSRAVTEACAGIRFAHGVLLNGVRANPCLRTNTRNRDHFT